MHLRRFPKRGCKCKHQYAVEFSATRTTTHNADGSTTVTDTVEIKATKKVTYKQDWPNYNLAQTNEKHFFQDLLGDLCKGVQTPPQIGRGQRCIPLGDAVFMWRSGYSTVSQRRFMCDLSDVKDRGYIADVPHFNSISNYLENPKLTPILNALIAESSKPLAAVESDFAVDSSGFATSRFVRWFDHKYGTVKVEHDWVKVHMMCGVKTNVITAVEIGDRNANDVKFLPALVEGTAKNFKVGELSADCAYASTENFTAIDKVGATPFIAFRSNITGGKAGSIFKKAFHFFSLNQDEFYKHYHKRAMPNRRSA